MVNAGMATPKPKGAPAARLRQRKFALLRRFALPPDLLPGSLAETHRRCGTPTCHCARGPGHPVWTLTFMVDGKKRVERIPPEWLDEVRRLVSAGRVFKEALAEVWAANAQLWALWRRQQGR
jgi:hypothetical protein